jgi:hypothetical protein
MIVFISLNPYRVKNKFFFFLVRNLLFTDPETQFSFPLSDHEIDFRIRLYDIYIKMDVFPASVESDIKENRSEERKSIRLCILQYHQHIFRKYKFKGTAHREGKKWCTH